MPAFPWETINPGAHGGGGLPISGQLPGDTFPRFQLDPDGTEHWGPGSSALDTLLSRASQGRLIVGSGATAVSLNGLLGKIGLGPTNATDRAVSISLAADNDDRIFIRADGRLVWGDGNALEDVDLYRGGAGQLKTDNDLAIVGKSGFQGTAPIAKPAVAGSRAANAALASLLTALANYGLITDGTSA